MRKRLSQEYSSALIAEICRSVEGVGTQKAGAVAEHFANLDIFLTAKKLDFQQLKAKSGNPILSPSAINGILAAKAKIIPGKSPSETWTFFLSRKFVENQLNMLRGLQFAELEINPLLIKALGITKPKEIVRFAMYQAVTRSVVTSWGYTVEEILRYSGGEIDAPTVGEKGARLDLAKVRNGKKYYLQIKSGPNSMNVDMVVSLDKAIRKLARQGRTGLLGITYGRKDWVSGQISGNLTGGKSKILVGRELWDFVSEMRNYHKRVIAILDYAARKSLKRGFVSLIDEKIKEFYSEWRALYSGKTINKVMEEYL